MLGLRFKKEKKLEHSSKESRHKPEKDETEKSESAKEKEVEKELKIIYRDSQGKLPNLTKLDFIPKDRTKKIIILTIFILFVILMTTLAGFFLFQPKPKFSNKRINLEIKAPFTISSGEKINYQIRFTNNEEISLTHVQLNVYLPTGFIFTNSNIPAVANADEKQKAIKTWEINDLFMGQSQIIDLNGRIIGLPNSKQLISATLSYIPANFSSEFDINTSFTTEINDSLINTSYEYLSQVADSELIEIKAKINNKSTQYDLADLEMDFIFPAEFKLADCQVLAPDQKSADIKFDKNKTQPSPKTLIINSLLPQEEKIIFCLGKFNVDATTTLDLNWQAKLQGAEQEYFVQKEDKLSIEVIKGELMTNLIIQGSNQNKPVAFGDTLNYLISLENKSKKTLGDLKVRAVIDSPLIDWQTLNDKNKGVQEANQILWTTEQISGLALLLPEAEIEISIQIKLKDYQAGKRYKADDLQVKSFFEVQINKMNNKDTDLAAESNTIINELNTNLDFKSEARYFDSNSQTIGSGPLPPIVGQKTSYHIFWKLSNELHEISDIEIKAKLPDYIIYEGKENFSTGNLFKNPSNEIVWQISRVPTSIKEVTADFEISLTPRPEDAHKILTLIQEITVIATDAQTKGQIDLSASGITTNLESDPLGQGRGLIQEE